MARRGVARVHDDRDSHLLALLDAHGGRHDGLRDRRQRRPLHGQQPLLPRHRDREGHGEDDRTEPRRVDDHTRAVGHRRAGACRRGRRGRAGVRHLRRTDRHGWPARLALRAHVERAHDERHRYVRLARHPRARAGAGRRRRALVGARGRVPRKVARRLASGRLRRGVQAPRDLLPGRGATALDDHSLHHGERDDDRRRGNGRPRRILGDAGRFLRGAHRCDHGERHGQRLGRDVLRALVPRRLGSRLPRAGRGPSLHERLRRQLRRRVLLACPRSGPGHVATR